MSVVEVVGGDVAAVSAAATACTTNNSTVKYNTACTL